MEMDNLSLLTNAMVVFRRMWIVSVYANNCKLLWMNAYRECKGTSCILFQVSVQEIQAQLIQL